MLSSTVISRRSEADLDLPREIGGLLADVLAEDHAVVAILHPMLDAVHERGHEESAAAALGEDVLRQDGLNVAGIAFAGVVDADFEDLADPAPAQADAGVRDAGTPMLDGVVDRPRRWRVRPGSRLPRKRPGSCKRRGASRPRRPRARTPAGNSTPEYSSTTGAGGALALIWTMRSSIDSSPPISANGSRSATPEIWRGSIPRDRRDRGSHGDRQGKTCRMARSVSGGGLRPGRISNPPRAGGECRSS